MNPHLRVPFGIVTLAACTALAASCVDPVHQGAVDALGPEVGGVQPSEFHRAGQPCTVCHQEAGPANNPFSIGGTVFYGPNKLIGAPNVLVEMVDSLGSNFVATTNCVGNFYIPPDVWNPAFPILVQVQTPDGNVRKMKGQIGREGSCAGCHHDPIGSDSPGHVAASAQDPQNPFIDAQCPVDPTLVAPGGL